MAQRLANQLAAFLRKKRGDLTYVQFSRNTSNDAFFALQGDAETGTQMGFYRVFDVTPALQNDAFAVEQYSAANQLDILKNDVDPNDDRLRIANLIPAHHGDIQYSLDAAVFEYTPDPDFWGIDSFAYTVTNQQGASPQPQ